MGIVFPYLVLDKNSPGGTHLVCHSSIIRVNEVVRSLADDITDQLFARDVPGAETEEAGHGALVQVVVRGAHQPAWLRCPVGQEVHLPKQERMIRHSRHELARN